MFTGLETQVDNSGFNNKDGLMSFRKTVIVTCPNRVSINLTNADVVRFLFLTIFISKIHHIKPVFVAVLESVRVG